MSSCGCFHLDPEGSRKYLPQLSLDVKATLLATSSRTTISQTFVNPSSTDPIPEISYVFPLYDGVSVVEFTAYTGTHTLHGRVKPKQKANEDYEEAKSKGQTAAILDQSVSASDVFLTRLGNIPANGEVRVEIVVLGELEQDAQTDGLRFTLPRSIAPRYGRGDPSLVSPLNRAPGDGANSGAASGTCAGTAAPHEKAFSIAVDVLMDQGSVIRSIQSPSHPIKVEMGGAPNCAKASLGVAAAKDDSKSESESDFIITVNADADAVPYALVETHPTIPDQRALMVSLVPKFGLQPITPEVVFVLDRSGSMDDKIATLRSALKVFLRSLPLGVHFNIISFGNRTTTLWPRSRVYDKSSFEEALAFADSVQADMGGTEILKPLQKAVDARYKDKQLEVLLLTDGQVWDQQPILDFVGSAAAESSTRFFTLGIGSGVSHAQIEGIARAGRGFSQSVLQYEELDQKVIRMLKGALSPHVDDYSLEVNLPSATDDDFDIVDRKEVDAKKEEKDPHHTKTPIPLYDSEYKESDDNSNTTTETPPLPKLTVPSTIQAPAQIPHLYPFIRCTAYQLFSHSREPFPDKITLRATSSQGPLALDIPVQDVGKGQTIHQLAAKKTMQDLEEGRGWVRHVRDNSTGRLVVEQYESRAEELVKTECERLGVTFQVPGKYCSFVAVQDDGVDVDVDLPEPLVVDETMGLAAPLYCMAAMPKLASRKKAKLASRKKAMPVVESAENDEAMRPASPMYSPQAFNFDAGGGGVDPLEGYDFDTFLEGDLASRGSAVESLEEHGQPSPAPAEVPDTPRSQLHELIDLQTFEGFWEWNDALFKTIGIEKETVEGVTSQSGINTPERRNIIATCLVSDWLERKFPESRGVWELVNEKARRWLETACGMLDHDGKAAVAETSASLLALLDRI